MSRVCCDVTSHNLIPSRVIWGLVRDRNTTTFWKYQQFHHNQGGWIGFQNHLAVCNYEKEANSFSFRKYCTLFSPSDFPNMQGSADLTIRMAWQTHIGPSEMPVKLDPSVCRIFLNSAEIPFMKANIQSFSTNAERLCESLGHGKRFAWTFAMLDQWLTGLHGSCTLATLIYLMPVILKRSANAVVRLFSLHTTQVVDFYGHRSFWKENISHCCRFNFKIHLENYIGQFETIWLWLSRWVSCFTSSSFFTS